jgi:hypothetical protein
MKFLSDSLARRLSQLSNISGYVSAIVGLAYFSISFIAFDKARTEKLLVVTPNLALVTQLLWLGLICVGAGALSLVSWLVVRYCAANPILSSAKQTMIRLLCWLPMIVAIVIVLRDAIR